MRKPQASKTAADRLTAERVAFSLDALSRTGAATGPRSVRISARIEPGLLRAAMRRSGIRSETELVRAALALMAEPDDFAAWLGTQKGRLPAEFELVR